MPDHLPSAPLLRLFVDGGASFFVTDSLVQDQPDQATLSMGNGPDGLVVSQARDRAAIHNVEDTSLRPRWGVGRLVENASHVAVALRRSVAVIHACALIVSEHPLIAGVAIDSVRQWRFRPCIGKGLKRNFCGRVALHYEANERAVKYKVI